MDDGNLDFFVRRKKSAFVRRTSFLTETDSLILSSDPSTVTGLPNGRIWLRLEWLALEAVCITRRIAPRGSCRCDLFRRFRQSLFRKRRRRIGAQQRSLAEYPDKTERGDGINLLLLPVRLRQRVQTTFTRSFDYATVPAYPFYDAATKLAKVRQAARPERNLQQA